MWLWLLFFSFATTIRKGSFNRLPFLFDFFPVGKINSRLTHQVARCRASMDHFSPCWASSEHPSYSLSSVYNPATCTQDELADTQRHPVHCSFVDIIWCLIKVRWIFEVRHTYLGQFDQIIKSTLRFLWVFRGFIF
jgi:hypothetical protein